MIKKKINMFKVDYSGWYKINARPSYIEKLDNNKEHYIPCKVNHKEFHILYAKCSVNGNVAIPKEFYKITNGQ